MAAGEDELAVEIGGNPFTIDRFNTTLYTFMGELALYDHLFIRTSDEEEEEGAYGGFVFENTPPENPTFQHIAAFICEHNFPMILNMTRVPPCDRQAFDKAVSKEFTDLDHIPDDWDE